MAADHPILSQLTIDGHGDAKCRLIQIEEDSFSILPDTGSKPNKQCLVKEVRATADGFTYKRNDKTYAFSIAITQSGIWIACELGNFRIKEAAVSGLNSKKRKDTNNPFVSSTLPGKIIEIKVKSGEQIEEGQTLILIESMKMEHSIKAETSARIKNILTSRNQAIDAGQALIELEFK